MKVDSHQIERLRWQCRRGMLELDMLLESFLENHFESLSGEQQNTFIELLNQPDPLLNAWIFGNDSPDYQPFVDMIQRLKK